MVIENEKELAKQSESEEGAKFGPREKQRGLGQKYF